MRKNKLNLIISVTIGLIIFIGTLWYFGPESLKHVYENLQPIYLIPFFILMLLTYIINALRIKIILKAYNHTASLYTLLKQNIAGYAFSYVTPSVRIGGEPLKAYMLNRECGVGIKTASSAVIIDKFVELFGSATVGLMGILILFMLPGTSLNLKILLCVIMIISFGILFFVYYMTIRGKGPFTSLFNVLRFYKISKWKKLGGIIKEVETKMDIFFKHHNKEFILSYILYFAYGLATIYEFKFVLLAIGVDATFIELILILVIWGLINFIPVPGGFGFQEAGQSSLFVLLKSSGGVGFAFTIITRLGIMFFVSIGFAIISNFSGGEIIKRTKESKNNGKRKKVVGKNKRVLQKS